jgi:CheY-like chemotaxis protein
VPQTVQFFLSLFIYYYHLIKNVALSQTCDTLQEQAIDMVLTDYCMPEMTGYDLLKAIKVLLPLLQRKICHRGIFCSVRLISACVPASLAANYS